MAFINEFVKKGFRSLLPLLGASLFAALAGGWVAAMAEEGLFLLWMDEKETSLASSATLGGLPAEKGKALSLKDFAAGDPFDASPGAAPAPVKVEEKEISPRELYDLEGLRIAGIIPGVAAWVEEGSAQRVYLKGEKVKGYDLLEVEDSRITLRKGNATVRVLLRYGGHATARVSLPSPPGPRPRGDNITAARPGERGSIPRETVDNLLMNPLEEMKKFRLRPKFDGDTALGVEVQWMDRGGFLESVGVRTGDVVQSVNGLEIRNMGDIVNVVNSLMGGDAFDVRVLRQGEAVSLKYNIR